MRSELKAIFMKVKLSFKSLVEGKNKVIKVLNLGNIFVVDLKVIYHL
jgi:hypothetical protein